jgi:hypothetical protein
MMLRDEDIFFVHGTPITSDSRGSRLIHGSRHDCGQSDVRPLSHPGEHSEEAAIVLVHGGGLGRMRSRRHAASLAHTCTHIAVAMIYQDPKRGFSVPS